MKDDYDVHDEDYNNYDKNYISYDDGDDDNYNDNDNGSDDADHRSSLKNNVVISLAYIMCPNNPFRSLVTFFGLMKFLCIIFWYIKLFVINSKVNSFLDFHWTVSLKAIKFTIQSQVKEI